MCCSFSPLSPLCRRRCVGVGDGGWEVCVCVCGGVCVYACVCIKVCVCVHTCMSVGVCLYVH